MLSGNSQASKIFVSGPAERIPQTPSQIEPIQGVLKHIREREFENGKGVAWRRLIIKRKMYGVSDGFRTRDLRIHNPAL
jgi:hypothetical protein